MREALRAGDEELKVLRGLVQEWHEKQSQTEVELVRKLAEWSSIPVTYAGGGRRLGDLDTVKAISGGKVDLTIGSALDCFGGSGVTLAECVEWNGKQ